MAHKMNDQEIMAFLMQEPRTGHVATIWFAVDGNDIVFVTSSDSVKAKNFSRTASAALAVDDDSPPFSYANVEGPVTVVDDMEQVLHWAMIIASRYIGEDGAKAFVQMDGFPDDLVCRLTPSHMTGIAAMMEQ
jgi:PPOX class probable F420-dependent enzyme